LSGGSPAGRGSSGSDLSGTRKGGSSIGGFFRRFGGSCCGGGGRFDVGATWRTKTLVVCAGCRESTSSFIFCSTISKPSATQRLAASTNVRGESTLGFTELKVIHHLFDSIDPTGELFGPRFLFRALYSAVQVNDAIGGIHIDACELDTLSAVSVVCTAVDIRTSSTFCPAVWPVIA
jgi:hypothetical protein